MTEPAGGSLTNPPRAVDAAADLAVNRDLWTIVNEQYTDAQAIAAWSTDELCWGLYGNPETTVQVLGDVAGLDVIELGCGTAFVSAWLARLGARPVGVDLTPAQLDTARRCQEHVGPSFPLIEADAAAVPLPDRSFDLVVSEYGACVWCDPERWIPEAARLLRPGGRLVFLTNSVQVTMCVPDEGGHAVDRLLRPQNREARLEWSGGGVEYHPSHGEWIRILRSSGFEVVALHELYASVDAETPAYYDIATTEWASRWPVEDLWSARLG